MTVSHVSHSIRTSGRNGEKMNSVTDLWLRPTDLSWHSPILTTIREEPVKNYRARSSAKLKTVEDKIEEAKKQKTKRSEQDEWNPAEWQPSSWSWQQPMTWTSSSSSSWQQWSSDQARLSVEIGNHRPIGVPQIKRVSVLDCDRRAHGSHHSHGCEE